ncbi:MULTISPECIES: hypothetical protein [Shewanella]|uniref:hypothetical protein n=1 Tax=Shewanella TaxID=22 RepID=UPI0004B4FAF5|nr:MULTISPECIES: hypothetical protein [Shewanella]QLE84066.1 hypothetical protein FLM48_02575 [Shewanella sp. Scap07]
MRSVKPLRLLFIAVSSLVITAQAQAGLEQNLAQCATITDKLDRLICYDNLAKTVKPQKAIAAQSTVPTSTIQTTNNIATPQTNVAAPAAESVSTVEQQFGNLKPVEEESIDKLYFTVSKVEKDAYGALKISFNNGQVWKQTDSKRYKVKSGERVYVEKGALTSFFLGSDNKNATIRVKRLK